MSLADVCCLSTRLNAHSCTKTNQGTRSMSRFCFKPIFKYSSHSQKHVVEYYVVVFLVYFNVSVCFHSDMIVEHVSIIYISSSSTCLYIYPSSTCIWLSISIVFINVKNSRFTMLLSSTHSEISAVAYILISDVFKI